MLVSSPGPAHLSVTGETKAIMFVGLDILNLHSRMFDPYLHVALPVSEYWLYLILIRWQKQEIDLCGFNQLVYKVYITYASSVWEVLLRQILNIAKWQ